jgi:hypothetical protein
VAGSAYTGMPPGHAAFGEQFMSASGDTAAMRPVPPVQDEPWTPRSALTVAEQPLHLGPNGSGSPVQTLPDMHAAMGAPVDDRRSVGDWRPHDDWRQHDDRRPMDLMGPAGPVGPDDHRGGPPSGRRPDGKGRGAGAKIAFVAVGAAVVVAGGAVAVMAMTGGDDKATVSAAPLADPAKKPTANPYAEMQLRRKLAYERALQAASDSAGDKPRLLPKGSPIPSKKPTPSPSSGSGGAPGAGNPVPAGEAQQIAKAMLPDFGFSPNTQFGCLVKLWDKESGWRVTAENPSSGAYGIPQALPGSKMATAGDDWRTSARTQIEWGLGYIKDRYGSPCEAWSHSQSVGWY